MLNKVIVVVSDPGDGSHGEINVLDGPEQAAEFVERLLESGFEQERVRVFDGDELQMQVRQRPVVSLISDASGRREEVPKDEEEEPAAAPQVKPEQEPVAIHDRAVTDEVDAQPFERNGVRFSSQFRPEWSLPSARPGSTEGLTPIEKPPAPPDPPVPGALPLTPDS